MADITLKNINKVYDNGFHAVQDFNLDIKDQEFIIFVGPSGCGKSTTLRMIAGLEDISSGELTIDGQVMNDVEAKDRNIAMVFQNYALYPHMTVYDNMAFSMKMKKVDKDTIDKRVREAARILDLDKLLDRKPKQLSGGQRQRVAMGRAIVRNPKVFLMDEPLSNLDAKLRVDMRSELKRLHHETGTTIIYVTHDQVEALTMSTKIALFRKGELVQVAPPLELYDNPKNLYVADFIGNPSINFVKCKAKLSDAGMAVSGVLGNMEFSRADMTPDAPRSGECDVTLGVRPEQITIQRERTSPTDVEARVYSGMPAGSETLVSVKVGDVLLTVKEIGSSRYSSDDTVYLSIHRQKINVFDTASEELIKYCV